MRHILCAMWQPSESLLDEIYSFGKMHDWQIELCGRRLPPGWFGDGILTDYLQPEELRAIRNFRETPVVSRELKPGEKFSGKIVYKFSTDKATAKK